MSDNKIDTQFAGPYDVVIVGGGIAGLYCCHELIKKNKGGALNIQSILLLEASSRFGGRIETWSLQRTGEQKGEAIGFQDTWDPCNWDFAAAPPDPSKPRADKESPYKGPVEKKWVQKDGREVEKVSTIEYFRAEFGPMRIEPRDQPLLEALLSELGIREQTPGEEESLDDLVPFSSYISEDPMEPRFTLREEEAQQKTPFDLMILALRRIFELVEDIEPEATDSQALNKEENKKKSGPWHTDAANEQWRNLHDAAFFYRHYWKGELLEWIHNLTDEDFVRIRQHARFRGEPLWNLGFWNVLSEVLSHYAVVKIRDWGSYYHFVHENLNAAEWIIFWLRAIRSTGSLRGIRGGMSRIIWRLLEKLHKAREENPSLCIQIQKNTKVTDIQSDGDAINVGFTVTNEEYENKEEQLVRAKRVILALPKRPLEEISWGGNPPVYLKKALNAVACLPLLKCFFVIERPWWEDNRPLNRYAADLPTRELLYVKSNDRTKGLIMVYTDRPAITFWSDYLREIECDHQKSHRDPAENLEDPQLEIQEMAKTWFSRKEKGPDYPRLWQRFVQFARDYEHHDFTQDRLLACGMRDWGKKPFGAAAHGWLPGVMSWKHIEYLEAFSLDQDNARSNVHICGEAFSDYQGFIEGALRSATRVLDRISAE
ncbi:flavin monoamine oxidase family protein [Nitrosovibrio tenuis]|uniref:NAD(P)-binding Rossmann-like domain-containing protein n=1 Tax=Nitrosovibrio tenuis TaxID=1233 RepID=A0A1H7P5D6_9PROT|nr:FAD-dependent oxidoreductase [Nitrosovibrio tenuis]SEL31001.1 NAD(P)-binding Rossmann-like domain-containing protein [Nitrosovibrio tenuis]